MKFIFRVFTAVMAISLFQACGPKSVTTDPVDLAQSSKSWIPYTGDETVSYQLKEDTLVFNGTGKTTYFETVRYKTDQSGFFSNQQDYYADLERQELVLESNSTNYFLKYFLTKNVGETGEWDLLDVTIADGDYYSNDMSILIYQSDSYNKGERFKFKSKMTLGGKEYSNVYYWVQERRPFEIYYTKTQGIVAFKLASHEMWTLCSK